MRRLSLLLSLLWLVPLSLSACENLNIHKPSATEAEAESPAYFQAAPLELKAPKSSEEMSPEDHQSYEEQRSLIAENASAFASATLSAEAGLTEENYIYSPISTWLCYELFLGGTSDSIRQKLREALEPQAMEDEAKLQAILKLSHQYQAADSTVQIHNALFVAANSQFQTDYLKYATHFLPALYTMDLEHHAHEVTEKINQLIDERTGGLIPRFYKEDLSPRLKSILMNITTLDANWRTQFDERETQGGDFHLKEGQSIQVPFMHQKISDDMLYAADEELYIQFSQQVARIEVSEQGTRAAAVTDIGAVESAMPPQETEKVTIRFDRPFAFLILDHDLVLFQGVVTDPSKSNF